MTSATGRTGWRTMPRRQFLAASAGLFGSIALVRPDVAAVQGGATRVFQHAMGESEIPVNPQRVVVLDGPQLDAAIALGITPVGAVPGQPGPLPGYLGDIATGIEVVGTIGEPDLEKILILEPDLILSSRFRHEDIYQQLSGIAPTVFTDQVGTFWKEDFIVFADALNRVERGNEIVNAYQDRTAALGAAVNAAEPDITVSVVRFLPSGVRIYLNKSFIGTVLIDLGLARPESQDSDDESRHDTISRERIRDVDGSAIFVTTYGDPAATELAEYLADPLWQQLTAVQNQRVFLVNDETWMVAIGYLAANLVLDDIENYLLNGVPATPIST